MAELVVDLLEVVEIREHDRERGPETPRALDLGVEGLDEAPAVDEAREVVRDGLALHDVVQAGVVERDGGLRSEPLGQLARLPVERIVAREELHRRLAVAGDPEPQGEWLAPASHLSDPRDLLAPDEDLTAEGTGRLADHLQD